MKEKSIAALRSGLSTIIIPKENERDVEDIPDEVKKKLEIFSTDNVVAVINKALVNPIPGIINISENSVVNKVNVI